MKEEKCSQYLREKLLEVDISDSFFDNHTLSECFQLNAFQIYTILFTCMTLNTCLALKEIFAIVLLSDPPKEQNLLSTGQIKLGGSPPSTGW